MKKKQIHDTYIVSKNQEITHREMLSKEKLYETCS